MNLPFKYSLNLWQTDTQTKLFGCKLPKKYYLLQSNNFDGFLSNLLFRSPVKRSLNHVTGPLCACLSYTVADTRKGFEIPATLWAGPQTAVTLGRGLPASLSM